MDNLATMACFHRRYDLGDKGHGYDSKDYPGWDAMEKAIVKREKPADILPIYMYDHSGLAISVERTGCFADRWDSGQIGFIFISKAKARKEFGELTQKVLEQIRKNLLAEVETYNQYLQGDVWAYTIRNNKGEWLDSRGGFYGQEDCIADAKFAAEGKAKKLAEEAKFKDATGQLKLEFAKE